MKDRRGVVGGFDAVDTLYREPLYRVPPEILEGEPNIPSGEGNAILPPNTVPQVETPREPVRGDLPPLGKPGNGARFVLPSQSVVDQTEMDVSRPPRVERIGGGKTPVAAREPQHRRAPGVGPGASGLSRIFRHFAGWKMRQDE